MTTQHDNLDPVESLLREFESASRAGVFRSTNVDIDTLVRPAMVPAWVGWLREPRIALSLAAVLLLAVTVWTWMFRAELRSIGARRDELALMTSAVDRQLEASTAQRISRFSSDCMTGPAAEADEPCHDSDLVADRHIDLRDFGLHQRTVHPR